MDNKEKLSEWLDEVKRKIHNFPYGHKENSWFFPCDIAPHSAQFKYRCKKLAEAGLLTRGFNGRWGYSYRISVNK